MLSRLKTALVESFAGAIAIGFLIAQGIQRMAYVVSDPLTRWIAARIQGEEAARIWRNTVPQRFTFELALPQLFVALFLLSMAFVLVRWLYFPAGDQE